MELITSIKQGDERAFNDAYNQLHDKVFYFFLKKTCNEEDAKDLLQNTFLKLWHHRHSLSEEYVLDQYVFTIARTIYIDFLRKNASLRKSASLQKELLDVQPAHSKEVVSMQFLLSERTLKEMTDMRRRVFLMHRIEGYSYKEIATILSIPVKSVDNHLSKALKQLRKLF